MEAQIAQKIASLTALLVTIDQRRAAATEAIVGVHAVVQGIRDSDAAHLIAAVDSIRDRCQAAEEALRQQASVQIGALKPQIDLIDGAVGQMQTLLGQIEVRAIELEGRANETARDAFDSMNTLLEVRQAQFEQFGSDSEQFIHILEEISTSLEDDVDDLSTSLDAALDETDGVINVMSDRMDAALTTPITEARETMSAFLGRLTDRIAEEVTPEIIDESVQNVVVGLRQSLAKLVQALCDALDELARKVMESINEGSGSRAALQPAIDALGSAIDAVMGELDRIRGLASSVGISI